MSSASGALTGVNISIENQDGVSVGSRGKSTASVNSSSINISQIVYFDGINDSVIVKVLFNTAGVTSGQVGDNFLAAHLITGQSSGGSGTGTTTATVDTAIGMVAPFAMDSVPTGWLHCDGSEVSRDYI